MSSPSLHSSSPPSSSFSVPFPNSEPNDSRSSPRNLFTEPQPPSHQRPYLPPPRLSSPRLFRDFFSSVSDGAERRQVTLPPANFQEDVSRALQSANQALQSAQEAFSSRTMNNREVVDLTGSPPGTSSQAHQPSRTSQPRNPSTSPPQRIAAYPGMQTRLVSILDGPPEDPAVYSRNRTMQTLRALQSGRSYREVMREENRERELQLERGRDVAAQEQLALRRQRENHAVWRRTQAQAQNRQQIQQSQSHQNSSSPPLPSAINQTQSLPNSRPSTSSSQASQTEAIDLTTVENNKTLEQALSKQRQDAVASQKSYQSSSDSVGRTILTSYKCPICMDTPKDATTTVCGHLFCHRCIIDTLKWSVSQRREGRPNARSVLGVCPVCRKPLHVKEAPGPGRTLIPLELKIMTTKKRKRDEKGKQKEEIDVDDVDDDNDEQRVLADGSEKENHKIMGKSVKRENQRESTDEIIWNQFMN